MRLVYNESGGTAGYMIIITDIAIVFNANTNRRQVLVGWDIFLPQSKTN